MSDYALPLRPWRCQGGGRRAQRPPCPLTRRCGRTPGPATDSELVLAPSTSCHCQNTRYEPHRNLCASPLRRADGSALAADWPVCARDRSCWHSPAACTCPRSGWFSSPTLWSQCCSPCRPVAWSTRSGVDRSSCSPGCSRSAACSCWRPLTGLTTFAAAFALVGAGRALDSGPLESGYVDAVQADHPWHRRHPRAVAGRGRRRCRTLFWRGAGRRTARDGGQWRYSPRPADPCRRRPRRGLGGVYLAAVVALVTPLWATSSVGTRALAAQCVHDVPTIVRDTVHLAVRDPHSAGF